MIAPALLPPMGWSSWSLFLCSAYTESDIPRTANLLKTKGFQAAGYTYVNLDDCWGHERGRDGLLAPAGSQFPRGMQALGASLHALNFSFGIYSDAGSTTCATPWNQAGSLGHELVDAQTFAAWGVEYLKYDNCNSGSQFTSVMTAPSRYIAMADALRAVSRPIVYSLAEGGGCSGPWNWAAEQAGANSWRIAYDATTIEFIDHKFDFLMNLADQNAPLWPAAGPGHWNDPDNLMVGFGLTPDEERTHFSLWSILKAPLILGLDVRAATPAQVALLTNPDVIAINQDPLGAQAHRAVSSGNVDVWVGPLAGGDAAVLVVNRGADTSAYNLFLLLAQLAITCTAPVLVSDVWSRTTAPLTGTLSSHASTLLRVTGNCTVARPTPVMPVFGVCPETFPKEGSPQFTTLEVVLIVLTTVLGVVACVALVKRSTAVVVMAHGQVTRWGDGE